MKFVILDRDGVINQDSAEFVKGPEEWIPIPGSLEAIARLNHAGFRIFIATNQSGLARGMFDINALNSMHHKLHQELEKHGGQIEGIFFCPHGPDDDCDCRKPKSGLYQQIADRTQQSLEGVPVIGDSFRDLEAALDVAARPILVLTGKGKRTLDAHASRLTDIEIYSNLFEAAKAIINA